MQSKALVAISVLAVTLFGVAAPTSADGPLPRPELAQRGKAATALVLVDGDHLSGAAFVIHPDGWLVTNAHVVKNGPRGGKEIQIALRSGESDQKILTARVMRTDKEKDLALLKVDGEKGLSALALGDSDRLTELTELIGFGFPYGMKSEIAKAELPTVRVRTSNVTSLRREGGALVGIQFEGNQIDGVLNPGHAGGPLLMADGTVAGMIRSGIGAGPSAQSIPAKIVKAFLDAPEISIAPPNLDGVTLNRPAEFRAEVVSLIPGSAQPLVELLLEQGEPPARKFPMTLKDGVYSATAVPIPETGPKQITITARIGDITIAGPVADREFKIGGKTVKLSQVRRMAPGADRTWTMQDGSLQNGPITGLDSLEVRLKEQIVTVELANADSVDFVPPAPPKPLMCTVVASVAGKEVSRASTNIPLESASERTNRLAVAVGNIAPTKLDGDRVVQPLPGYFSDVCAGGGGRYLLFGLSKQNRIALFDISQARIVHFFPAPDPGAKFAAGAEKLVIALPGPRIIQRWSLSTLERELSVPFPGQNAIESLQLGHASDGPVYADGMYLDLATLKPMNLKRDGHGPWPISATWSIAAMSADGTIFAAALDARRAMGGVVTWTVSGETIQMHYERSAGYGYAAPSWNGRWIYTEGGIYTSDLRRLGDAKKQERTHFIPALQGNMYLGLTQVQGTSNDGGVNSPRFTELTLYAPGEFRTLVQLKTIEEDLLGMSGGDSPFWVHKRVWLVPDAKVLITLSGKRDAMTLHRFDLDEALQKAGTDYLFVVSEPPNTAKKGERYSHQLVVKSKRGNIKYRLDAGPQGMRVTPAGLIEWQVPAESKSDVTVIVSISDASGQEIFKTFSIKVG